MIRAFILGAIILGVAGVAFMVSGAWLPGATYAALSLTWFLLARSEHLRRRTAESLRQGHAWETPKGE